MKCLRLALLVFVSGLFCTSLAQTLNFIVNADDYNEAIAGFYDEVAQMFMEMHPGTTVNFDVFPNGQLADQIRIEGFGGGGLHDAAVTFDAPALAADGVLEDVTEEITAWPGWEGYTEGQKSRVSFDGRVYGVTLSNNTNGLYYNRAMLEEAGVDPASLTTMDGFIAALEQVRDAGLTSADGDAVFPLSINASRSDWFTSNFIYGAGGNLTDAERTEITVDTPEFAEGFSLLRRLFEDDLAALPDGDYGINRGLFEQGKAAFWISGEWDASVLRDALGDELGFIAQPVWKRGAVPLGGAEWVVPIGSPNRELATDWLLLLVSKPVQQLAFEKYGRVPVELEGAVVGAEDDPILSVILESVKNNAVLLDSNRFPDAPEVSNLWFELIDEVIYSDTPIEELLSDYQSRIDAAFAATQ